MKTIKTLVITNMLLMLLFFPGAAVSQSITQSLKGNVYDITTKEPLFGATVLILNSDPVAGTTTDFDGNFNIRNTPLGRHSIQVQYVGYDPAIISEVLVTSGKEVMLDIGLRQSVSTMEGVVVTAQMRKDLPLNSMATNSARSFTVEETRRYAGGFDDPARLVSAFAGVTVGNIQDNAIIVRGNSPKGVSWRLEGVEIPTPHHFAGGNVAGGGIFTIFSSQMLANSDFFTSAFPAEYGNATAGVFDMKLRNGNYDKREHTVQAGLLGIDVSSEGPISKDSNASYLFNYRYSTLGLLTDLNVVNTDQEFRYQDLSFKVNVPTRKAGVFSLWGIGGIDHSKQPLQTDSTKWEVDWDRVQYDWDMSMGAVGMSHRMITGRQTYINTTIAATGLKNRMETFRQDDNLNAREDLFAQDNSGKLSIGSYINHRLSRRHTVKTGATYKRLFYDLDISSTINHQPDTYRNVVDENGSSHAMEFYTQWMFNITDNLTLNSGVNANYFGVNEAVSFDPRAGLNWEINQNHALSFAYGRHSQMEELKIYFTGVRENGNTSYPNKDLGLTKAHHLVLGYDWRMSDNHRLKIETYYQHLNNVPGIADSSYSMINYKQDWAFSDELVNNGIGRNTGVDVTFERFLSNNYYYLVTGSLFNSRYKGGDGEWRNTRFNKKYVVNALIGREFFFQENRKVLGANIRINYVGGERVSPVLMDESLAERRQISDESQAFKNQLPSNLFVDLTITWRNNRANRSGVWALQLKNILGEPIYEGYDYNLKTSEVQMFKNVAVIPSLSYKLEF